MISVCMATFNGEQFIKQQIDSILIQLKPEDELIISDDGSTDKTLEIIESYNDSRIKVFQHQKNPAFEKIKQGKNFYYATNNFENALKYAKGSIIFMSDHDDIWLPQKIEKCVAELENCDCVVHNYQIINKDGIVQKKCAFEKKPLYKTYIGNLLDSHFKGCCMAFKSEYLKTILPIPQNIIGHDYWIGLLIFKLGKTNYLMEPLIQSRWYPESVSAKKRTSIMYKILYRTNLFVEILKREKTK